MSRVSTSSRSRQKPLLAVLAKLGKRGTLVWQDSAKTFHLRSDLEGITVDMSRLSTIS
jgi:hypothetical protein